MIILNLNIVTFNQIIINVVMITDINIFDFDIGKGTYKLYINMY